MASIAHALTLMPPVRGKVYSWSFSSSTGIDMQSALGTGAASMGGYIDVIFSADCYVAFGPSGTVVTPTGSSAGMYVPGGVRQTWEIPGGSAITGVTGYNYLYATAAAGTVSAWAHKSSASDQVQFRHYLNGERGA